MPNTGVRHVRPVGRRLTGCGISDQPAGEPVAIQRDAATGGQVLVADVSI